MADDNHSDEEVSLGEEGFVEGIDSDYDSEEDEDYHPDMDLEDELEDGIEDLDDEEIDEDDQQVVQQFIRGLGPLPPRGQGPAGPRAEEISKDGSKPWQGLGKLPEATQKRYTELLKRLKGLQKSELTVLLLGKHYAGKSHTVNSLLNEESASKQFLNRESAPTKVHTREAHGLRLNLIDPGAPTELDRFSSARMQEIVKQVEGRPIDAVLYVDRFDAPRTDGADHQIISGITQHLGSAIWSNAVICLTRAGTDTHGFTFDQYAEKRSSKLRDAIRKHGRNPTASIPAAYVENDDSCQQNSEGEFVLPNQEPWLPALMQRLVEIAETEKPYQYNKAQIQKSMNPNKQLRWLVPVVFVAQLAIKRFVLDPMLKDDYHTGDKNGPYEPSVVKGRRAIARMEGEGQVRKGTSRKQPSRSRKVQMYDSDSD